MRSERENKNSGGPSPHSKQLSCCSRIQDFNLFFYFVLSSNPAPLHSDSVRYLPCFTNFMGVLCNHPKGTVWTTTTRVEPKLGLSLTREWRLCKYMALNTPSLPFSSHSSFLLASLHSLYLFFFMTIPHAIFFKYPRPTVWAYGPIPSFPLPFPSLHSVSYHHPFFPRFFSQYLVSSSLRFFHLSSVSMR